MRTNIVLDDDLVSAGLKLTGAKTKRELVNLALRELVQQRRRKDLMDLYGKGGIDPDYDYKKLREESAFFPAGRSGGDLSPCRGNLL